MSRIELIRELIDAKIIEINSDMRLINKYDILEDQKKVDAFKAELAKDQAKLAMLQSKLEIELAKESQT